MALNKLMFFKFVELVIAVICIGLHHESLGELDKHTIILVPGTFVGFTVIFIALFAGYIMSTPVDKRLDLFFSIVGCALFIASGALIIDYWDQFPKSETRSIALSKGSLAIINGAVLLVDAILTFRG